MNKQSNRPSVFIVVLNYNGGEKLKKCLASIYQSNYPHFEVVVVDNASRDKSFENARAIFSGANFIQNTCNEGFSKGINLGVRFSLEKFADYVFILNNDAYIEKNTLSSLVSCAQQTNAGIINPLIKKPSSENYWFAGGTIDWMRMKTKHRTDAQGGVFFETDYCTGCAALIRKDVFEKIGLFDERYFLYYEDADFSFRAKKKGFRLLVNTATTAIHDEQSESENTAKLYWLVYSGMLFFKTNASWVEKIWMLLYVPIRRAKNYSDLLFKKSDAAKEIFRAYRDFENIY